MFRRKTDQVYATLQQVQRRLTDATQAGDEGEVFGARPKPPPPPLPTDPLRAATAQAQAVNGQAPTAPVATTAPPPAPSTASFQRRNSLHFSGELATVLFLLWVVTLTAAFFIGKHVGGRAVATDPGAGYAAGAAGSRSTRATTPSDVDTSVSKSSTNAGGYVLVLQSVARASAESEAKMGALARQLNDFADQNPRHGYKSWFAVRKPSNGGLQLVYGLVNGKFGIDKAGLEGFADTFDRAGYKESHWVRVDEQ